MSPPTQAWRPEPAALPQATSPLVRQRVEDLLSRSESYWQLPADRRQALSDDMVKVAQFIVGGSSGHSVPRTATLVGAPQTASALGSFLGTRMDPAGQTAGSRFAQGGGAVAAKQGTADYTGMIRDVNFPAFVAGLIDGVFNAIVTSSIKQMDAYAELVKNVAKSVDDFMKDNISENSARDYLANRYPDQLQVDTSGDSPALKPKEGADDSSLPDFFKDLGLAQPVTSLDQDTAEQVLMPAARQRMAMDRQQLLATMVLMGINRLVVTDGHIQASCTFTLDTTNSVKRHYDTASQRDSDSSYSEKGQVWYNPNAHTTAPIPRISLSPPTRAKTRRPRPRSTRSSEARSRSTSRAMCSRSRRWRTPCRSARYSKTLRPACRRKPRLARLPRDGTGGRSWGPAHHPASESAAAVGKSPDRRQVSP